ALGYDLNLGVIEVGATVPAVGLAAFNAASGLADLMSGTFQISGATGFTNTGFDAFSGLGAGEANAAATVGLSTAQAGTISETIPLLASGGNSSGYVGTLAPRTVTVTGTVVPARTLVWTGSDTNFSAVANWTDTDAGGAPATDAPRPFDTVVFNSS